MKTTMMKTSSLLLVAGSLLATPGAAPAQQPAAAAATRAIGAQYEATEVERTLVGSNWRNLWIRPLTMPFLDLEMRGGLTPERQGGGAQSITLHLEDASGRGWVFRSIDKFPERQLPSDLRGTVFQDILQDQVSAMHPGAHFAVPRMLEALGILHVTPVLYVMPDDPRLGRFRETFAGMIGMLEPKPEPGPDGTPGLASAVDVEDSEDMLDDLEDSPDYRVADNEYLRARLLDFIINDTDRGRDQWDWARFGEEGNWVYRPIPRDRDWAFVNARGPVAALVRGAFPKHAPFDDEFPSLDAFTFSSHILDRRLLMGLTRADFEWEVAQVKRLLTDEVIEAAVRDLPRAFQPGHAEALAGALRLRRDRLSDIVDQWYAWLVTEPDLHATDVDERVSIEHLEDGAVRVRMARAGGEASYFERTFLPSETNEIRVYLHGGDDHATVTGQPGRIKVRVIGGGGDDTLEDFAGKARFYEQEGNNRIRRMDSTRFSDDPWNPLPAPEGLRLGHWWRPDWGSDTGLSPTLDYHDGAGVIVGVSRTWVQRGFRRLPYRWALDVNPLYSLGDPGVGLDLDFDYRFENARRGFIVDARATQFESFRFYGFGNDSPDLPSDVARIMQDQVRLFAGIAWDFAPNPGRMSEEQQEADEEEADGLISIDPPRRRGRLLGSLRVGPIGKWTRSRPEPGNPFITVFGDDRESFGQVGARAELALERTDRRAAPRSGWKLDAAVDGYPAVWDAADAFTSASVLGRAYIPVRGPMHLALRLGGERVLGDAPPFEHAHLGGRTTLRGYRYQRFTGDASAYGAAELRVPLDSVRLIVNGELGLFGLADVGRVWFDGDSDGGWHTAAGGGVWFSSMNRAISLTYARGSTNKFYIRTGLPF